MLSVQKIRKTTKSVHEAKMVDFCLFYTVSGFVSFRVLFIWTVNYINVKNIIFVELFLFFLVIILWKHIKYTKLLICIPILMGKYCHMCELCELRNGNERGRKRQRQREFELMGWTVFTLAVIVGKPLRENALGE